MGDLSVPRQKNFLAKPSKKVERLWLEQQIAEKQARSQRLKADAYELIHARLKSIEADTIMVDREIVLLEQRLDDMDRADDVVDVVQPEE